jgi:hypothetical protein
MKPFTVLDQIIFTTICKWQKSLVEAIAKEELPLPSSSSISSSITTTNTVSQTDMENPSKCYTDSTLKNVKNILQTQIFENVLKEGAYINKVWSLVDERKLPDGVSDLIREYQRSKQDHQNKCLCQIDDTVTITAPDCDIAKFLDLHQFAIPMVNTSIHALLRGIVALEDKYPGLNFITFQAFNGKPCTLVNPISSCPYKYFKQNVN